MEDVSVVIDGLDLIDVIQQIDKKKAKFIRLTLDEVEAVIANKDDYMLVRKAILDGYNDYTRSFMRAFFGDIEGSRVR